MAEDSTELLKKAETTFRAECIDILLSVSLLPENDNHTRIKIKNVPKMSSLLEQNLVQPMEPSTNIVPEIGEDGRISGFTEELRPLEEFGLSTNSMSLCRLPSKSTATSTRAATYIRGSSCNIPFLPGFADKIISETKADGENTSEDNYLEFKDNDLLFAVPGMDPVFLKVETTTPSEPTGFDIESSDVFDILNFVASDPILPALNLKEEKKQEEKQEVKQENGEKDELLDEIPNLVIKVDLEEASTEDHTKHFAFAKEIPTIAGFPEYDMLKPTMARQFPFSLDPFQQASVLSMEKGESLFVAAHTSAGKTVVAEYAIAMCKRHKTKAIYTSPIKALSNQKFRDFKQIFDDVGLVTGDIQLNREAFCLIMTTEILQSMLYNGSEVIRDLEWVVFDEVHYINNQERGHVWEEVLIMLPPHVKIVMLSATVPNCVEFADWVGRIKNRTINVISTYTRPVPLEHFLYTGQDGKTKNDLFKIVNALGQWEDKGYHDATEAKLKIHGKEAPPQAGRGGGQVGRGGPPHRGGGQRGGGRGGPAPRGGGGGSSGKRGFSGKNDKNIYYNVISHMKESDNLPMVVFLFSRKRCDENAQLLSSMDLTSEVEKQHVRRFFNQCVERLKGSDKELPQVLTMRELCLRGFAVHHSGILPILKEVVEILFQRGYVKILFATETFAMGVNMPARCVVFDSITKHDGIERRTLNTGEYIQMAGRAGRRGLDSTGTVVVLCKEAKLPQPDVLKSLMQGKALSLESKFRVTYSMLLNLIRVEQLQIEDMLKRSYFEKDSLRTAGSKKKALGEVKEQQKQIKMDDCAVCNVSLPEYHTAMHNYLRHKFALMPFLAAEPGINKQLTPGRFLIVNYPKQGLHNEVVMLLKEMSSGDRRSLQVMVAHESLEESDRAEHDAAIFSKMSAAEQFWEMETQEMKCIARIGTNGVREAAGRKMFRICEVPMNNLVFILKKLSKAVSATDVLTEDARRKIPRFRNDPISNDVAKYINQLDDLVRDYQKGLVDVYSFYELSSMCTDPYVYKSAIGLVQYHMAMNPNNFPARHCTRFDAHLNQMRNKAKIDGQVIQLEHELSGSSLLLIEEYKNKLMVLRELNYVEADNMVTLRGRIACEIHHQELIITELILNNKFVNRTTAEVAAMLSALTCQYNSGNSLTFPDGSIFATLSNEINETVMRLQSNATKYRAQVVEMGCEIRMDLMDVVYNWASGMPFSEIMKMTEAQEGLIVKCIQRVDEVCKDVRNAARIVGDPSLVEKMEEVSSSIRRDIVFAASLYTSV